MNKNEIINHELGHGIIAFIFHGDYYNFEEIKLDIVTKLNPNDEAYTISKPVNDLNNKVDNDNHLASSIDGLFLLAGVAGLTVFLKNKKPSETTNINYKNIFDFRGASGDLEIIKRGNRPYGWYLNNALLGDKNKIDIRNSRLLNVLGDFFTRQEILTVVPELKNILNTNNVLTYDDFDKSFDSLFIVQAKTDLINMIKTGLGKPILVD